MEHTPYPLVENPPDFKKVLQWSHKTVRSLVKYYKCRRLNWKRNVARKVDKVYRSDENIMKDLYDSSGIFEVLESIIRQSIDNMSNLDGSKVIDPIECVKIIKQLKKSLEVRRRNVCHFDEFLFKAYCISTDLVNIQEHYLESILGVFKLSSLGFIQWLRDDLSILISRMLDSLISYPYLRTDLFQTSVAIVFEKIRSHVTQIQYEISDSFETFKRSYGNTNFCAKLDEVLQAVNTAFDVTEKNVYKRFQSPSLLLIPTQESLEETERIRMEILEIPARVDVSVVLSCSRNAIAEPSESVMPSGIESMQKLLRLRHGYKRFDHVLSKCLRILKDSGRAAVNQKKLVLEAYKSLLQERKTSLKMSLAQCDKFVKDGTMDNRDQAITYLNFMVGKEFNVTKKPDTRKYIKEIKFRTDFHIGKMRELGQHIEIFFSQTFKECSALLEEGLGEEKVLEMVKVHKESACHSILRAYQAEFATIVENAHAQLSYIIQEIGMEEKMEYAMGEFVRGLKWADHNYMAQIVQSSVECLDSIARVGSFGSLHTDFHFSLYEIENMMTKFFQMEARESAQPINCNSNEGE